MTIIQKGVKLKKKESAQEMKINGKDDNKKKKEKKKKRQ